MNLSQKKAQSNNGSHYGTAVLAFLAGATAGVAVGICMAPKATEMMEDGERAVGGFMHAARAKSEELQASVSDLAQRGMRAVQRAGNAVDSAVDEGARDAHGAINSTVAAVNAGAKKGHEVVNTAAEALRTGNRGQAA